MTLAILLRRTSQTSQTTKSFHFINPTIVHLIDDIFGPWVSKAQILLIRYDYFDYFDYPDYFNYCTYLCRFISKGASRNKSGSTSAVCLQRPSTILEKVSALLFTLHGWPLSRKHIQVINQPTGYQYPPVHSSTTTNNNTTVLLRRQHAVRSRAAVRKHISFCIQ